MKRTHPLASALLCALAALSCRDAVEPNQARIQIHDPPSSLYVHTSATLRATVYGRGGGVAEVPVAWFAADSSVARVYTADTVSYLHAQSAGRTTVFALADGLAAQFDVTVHADSTAPALEQARITPAVVDLSGGAVRVVASARATDAQSGVGWVGFVAREPSRVLAWNWISCGSRSPAAGSSQDGAWQCGWILNPYLEPGVWEVSATVGDRSGNVRSLTVPLTVTGSLPDTTPPVLTVLRYDEERTTPEGHRERFFRVGAADAEAGIHHVDVWLADERGEVVASAGVSPPPHPADGSDWRHSGEIDDGYWIRLGEVPGRTVLTIVRVRLVDLRGNERVLGTAELDQGGFLTRIDVSR